MRRAFSALIATPCPKKTDKPNGAFFESITILAGHNDERRVAITLVGGQLATKFQNAFVHWKLGCMPKAG